jgi:uncharacterized membrane protein
MSIYDNGVMYPWEIWVGIALAVIILYFGVRATRKAAHRHERASGSTGSPTRK